MRDAFIGIITMAAAITWVVYLGYFVNASYPHSGGWQFFLGSGLMLVIVTGAVASRRKD